MPVKKPKFQFAIICDDIREEIGGKVSLMGIYKKKIFIPQKPFTFPKLCIVIYYTNIKSEDSFTATLHDPEGKKIRTIQGSSPNTYKGDKELEMYSVFTPLVVDDAGKYILEIIFNDDPKLKQEITIDIEVAK